MVFIKEMADSLNMEFTLSKPQLKNLYQKIGGEAGLREILQDFYRRMANDTLIGFFFSGKDLEHIALQQQAFLMRAMGATLSYSGKPPAQAHDELPPILKGHFDRRLRLLEETLKDHGLSEDEIRTWISFENAFRSAVMSS
jgi:hemoglobin